MSISGDIGRDAMTVIEELRAATNAHDLDALVALFSPTYVNKTPAHPSRGFSGREQVRENWSHIFSAVPDIAAHIIRSADAGMTLWSEWDMIGTRLDGRPHRMAGVIVFTISEGLIAEAAFYLEPVEDDAGTVGEAVGRAVGAPALSGETAPQGGGTA